MSHVVEAEGDLKREQKASRAEFVHRKKRDESTFQGHVPRLYIRLADHGRHAGFVIPLDKPTVFGRGRITEEEVAQGCCESPERVVSRGRGVVGETELCMQSGGLRSGRGNLYLAVQLGEVCKRYLTIVSRAYGCLMTNTSSKHT